MVGVCLLTNEVLQSAYPFMQDGQQVELDLTKELRQQSFPYLLHILKHPNPSLISHHPHPLSTHHDNNGYLYMFDNKTSNYLEDNIQWALKRMNIKLILHIPSKNTYKLKNHKEDVGECVMRRQTWSGVSDVVVWRRSEYKLMNRVTANGREEFYVQDFPVLIHYYTQTTITAVAADPSTPATNIPLKQEDNEIEDDMYALPATSPITTHSDKRKFDANFPDPPHLPQEFIPSFWTSDDQVDPNVVPMSPSQILNIFTQGDALATLESTIKSHPSQPPIGQFAYAPAYQPKIIYPQLDNVTTTEIRTYAPDTGPMQEGAKILICVHGFSFFDQYLFPDSQASQSQPQGQSTPTQSQQTPQQTKGGMKSRKKTVNTSPSSSHLPAFGATHPITMSSVNSNNVYYYSFWCVFDFGVEVPATPIAPGVVEVQAPPRAEPGPIKFWLVYKENSSKKILQISNQALFHYLPTDERGKVSVCIQRVAPVALPIDEMASRYKYTTRELDLSHNNLLYPSTTFYWMSFDLTSNVQFLLGFPLLHTLQLDHNSINSQTTFPHLPTVHTLSLRHNAIRTLEPFIVNLAWSFQNMMSLDLEGNEAAPNRGKPHFHYNYRVSRRHPSFK